MEAQSSRSVHIGSTQSCFQRSTRAYSSAIHIPKGKNNGGGKHCIIGNVLQILVGIAMVIIYAGILHLYGLTLYSS